MFTAVSISGQVTLQFDTDTTFTHFVSLAPYRCRLAVLHVPTAKDTYALLITVPRGAAFRLGTDATLQTPASNDAKVITFSNIATP